jgi:hypothetical protein
MTDATVEFTHTHFPSLRGVCRISWVPRAFTTAFGFRYIESHYFIDFFSVYADIRCHGDPPVLSAGLPESHNLGIELFSVNGISVMRFANI